MASGKIKRLYLIPILSKALDVLEMLEEQNASMTLEDVYQRTQISKTSVYRILKTLVCIFKLCGIQLCLLLGGQSLLPATVVGWTILVGLAFVSYAVGQGLLTVALAHVGPTFSAVSLLVLPVTAALYGWLIFSEALTLNWAIGAAIVLASILAARLAALPAASPGPR